MKSSNLENIQKDLKKIRSAAAIILRELEVDDIRHKLETLKKLEGLPELPVDSVTRELKEYAETRDVYKRLYTSCARTIMTIISSNFLTGTGDPANSFNYSEPLAPLQAAEMIAFLPRAYMGGPIKAAAASQFPNVRDKAAEFYDSLPHEMKYSGSFPPGFRNYIRTLKSTAAAHN